MWRSKRAVIVGDPRQLEPTVTVPFVAQQRLGSEFGVAERWLPSRSSVQVLADALTGSVPYSYSGETSLSARAISLVRTRTSSTWQ